MTAARAALLLAALVAPLSLRAVPLPHLKLQRSFPAADTTLAAAPARLELWFSEAPELPMSKITLTAAGGATVAVGALTRGREENRPSLVVPVTGTMGPGTYTVSWRAGSKDGHPVNGSYRFSVGK